MTLFMEGIAYFGSFCLFIVIADKVIDRIMK